MTIVDDDYDAVRLLQSIGLTKAEAACYARLARALPGRLEAAEINDVVKLSHAGLYSALKRLHQKGFIETSRVVRATDYRAVALSRALDNYADWQRRTVRPLTHQQHQQNP